MKTTSDAKNTAWEITKSFEGGDYGSLFGNFDSQGWTAGILGWNWGQGSLQPLIKSYYKANPALFKECCTVYVKAYNKIMDLSDILLKVSDMNPIAAVKWSLDRQKNNKPDPHWIAVFYNLGEQKVFQGVQRNFAQSKFEKAAQYCLKYRIRTERAFALFFDCIVQQGSIKLTTHARILASGYDKSNYEDKLEILARSMAAQAKTRWRKDVLSRRLCIAKGKGRVHGRNYDLDSEFNLTDDIVVQLPKTTPRNNLLQKIKEKLYL